MEGPTWLGIVRWSRLCFLRKVGWDCGGKVLDVGRDNMS